MTNLRTFFGVSALITALAVLEQPVVSDPLVIPVGANTAGGLAGNLIRVTNLNAAGPDSLRAAIETRQPRLVVFEVGGVIDLGGLTIIARHPHLTIAGQTAPDPGITLIRGSLSIETHDVIVQHIAVRPGDRGGARNWAPDAIGVRKSSQPVHDVVFDHISATWAIDENLSTSGPADVEAEEATAHDITLRYCLVAEALSRSTHPKGEHSKGTLVHDGVRNVAIHGCVFAHNRERNPRLKGGTSAAVMNSVMYNWGSACIGVGAMGNRRMLAPAEAVVSGNVAIAGPDTRNRVFIRSNDAGGRVALGHNVAMPAIGMVDDGVVLVDAAIPRSDPWKNAERALRSAGSRPARRDPIDARIIATVIRGDGRIINSQDEVGGYPVRAETKRALVVPETVQARKTWLEKFSMDLEEDRGLDVGPLRRRLGVMESGPAASPDARTPDSRR